MQLVRQCIILVFFSVFLVSHAIAGQYYTDTQGTLHYEAPGTRVDITKNMVVLLNGNILADCSKNEMFEMTDNQGNAVSRVGDILSVELADGTQIEIVGSIVSVESSRGESIVEVQVPGTDVNLTGNSLEAQGPGYDVDVSGRGVNVQAPGVNIEVSNQGVFVR